VPDVDFDEQYDNAMATFREHTLAAL